MAKWWFSKNLGNPGDHDCAGFELDDEVETFSQKCGTVIKINEEKPLQEN